MQNLYFANNLFLLLSVHSGFPAVHTRLEIKPTTDYVRSVLLDVAQIRIQNPNKRHWCLKPVLTGTLVPLTMLHLFQLKQAPPSQGAPD